MLMEIWHLEVNGYYDIPKNIQGKGVVSYVHDNRIDFMSTPLLYRGCVEEVT